MTQRSGTDQQSPLGDDRPEVPTPGGPRKPLGCRIFGHDYSFRADGRTMTWFCSRNCGSTGAKHYESSAQAQRYAAAFDKRDRDDLGRRAPLIGLLPLRIWRWLSRKDHKSQRSHRGNENGQ